MNLNIIFFVQIFISMYSSECIQPSVKLGVVGSDMRLHWPPPSPDLNIIEASWDHADREHSKKAKTSKEEL